MKRPIDLIHERYNSLRESEKRVARFIQNHAEEVVMLSLQALAKKCATSDATVLRFCRSLGYYGFSDFKAALVPDLIGPASKAYMQVDPQLNSSNKMHVFFGNFQRQLDSTLRNCDYEVIQTVASCIAQAEKTSIVGLGGSAGVAYIFSDALGGIGIFSSCTQDSSVMQNIVTMMKERDVFFCISHSGETEEVVSAAKQAKEHGIYTVAITNFSPSPLADAVDVSMITGVPENLLGSYSCQARISQLAILELILFEISEELAKLRLLDIDA